MIYLSGAVRDEVLGRYDMGVMLTPNMGNRPDLSRTWWGADTGCYTQPATYSDERYLRWLDGRRRYWSRCLFATAPDVVGDAEATLCRSLPVLPLIRSRVRAAFVGQDGLEQCDIPWDAFDCLFIGGTTKWKLSEWTYNLVVEARERGKWTHMGRCNSQRRFLQANAGGYDSADGTFIAFGPDKNIARVEQWLRLAEGQPALWGANSEWQDEEEMA